MVDRISEHCKARKPESGLSEPDTTVSLNLRVCDFLISRLEANSLRSFLSYKTLLTEVLHHQNLIDPSTLWPISNDEWGFQIPP